MSEVSHSDLHRQIGVLQEGLNNVKEDMREVRSDVKLLVANDEQRRGRAKLMVAVSGIAGGGIGALVTKLLANIRF